MCVEGKSSSMLLGGRSSSERVEGARHCELKKELVNVVMWKELVRAN